MTFFRVHKTKNFTIMSNTHFKEKEMSLKSKGLLSLMLSLPDDWNFNISGLCKLSKDGKDSVMSALAELEKFGYLERKRTTDSKGRFSGVEYNIYEQPQPKNPITEEPHDGSPNSANSNAENQRQLNTNSIKNLKELNMDELSTKEHKPGGLIPDEIYEILIDVEDTELRELYMDYVLMRNNTKAPLTPKGLEMLIARCERLSDYRVDVQKGILETAIINNWQNVYAPREEEYKRLNNVAEEHKKIFFGE